MIRRRDFITLLGGAVGAWPLPASGQQPLPVIGFLHQGFREPPSTVNAFKKGLSEVGIIEGQNATFEDRVSLMCVLEMGHAQTLDGSLPIPQYGVRVDELQALGEKQALC
jgi:hypothetical protein